MKKKFIGTGIIHRVWIVCSVMCACTFGLSSCGDDYNDSELRSDFENLEDRITALEEWQKSVNTDIRSLQSLVTALENKDYVTGVTPLEDGTGYVISFLKSGNVTIKHGERGEQGEKGEDGTTPVISVKQDADGKYYWTVNGEWLLDSGNKIPVTGEKGDKGDTGDKGADAIAPQVRINNETNEWEISTDNGTTWTSTGVKATGDKGNTGAQGEKGDSMFSDIDNSNDNYVELTLADGVTKINLPKYAAFSIAFESDEVFYASPTENELTLVLPVTLKESDYRSIVATVTATNGAGVQTRSTGNQWNITITKPTFSADGVLVEGSAKVAIKGTENTRLADTYLLRVALVATNGTEVSASRLVKYFDGTVAESQSDITDNTVSRLAWKGNIAETDFAYIRKNLTALEVLDLSDTGMTVFPNRALRFESYTPNTTLKEVILPEGLTTLEEAAFANCTVLEKLNVPSTVTTLGRWILENTKVASFTIPAGVTEIPTSCFYGSAIISMVVPSTVTSFADNNGSSWAFEACMQLKSLVIESPVNKIPDAFFWSGQYDVNDKVVKTNLTSLILPDEVETIGHGAFNGCPIINLKLPANLKSIWDEAFAYCKITELILPEGFTELKGGAFRNAPLEKLDLPSTIEDLNTSSHVKLFNGAYLKEVICRKSTPPALSQYFSPFCDVKHFTFVNETCVLKVPATSVDVYKNSDWSKYFKNIEAITN